MVKRCSFTAQEETLKKLKELSEKTRVPVSRYLEEAIQYLLNKYTKEFTEDKN